MLVESRTTLRLRRAARHAIAACAVGLAGTATVLAADIPPATKARPLVGSPTSWAGFYLGVHGGYGWGDNNFSQTAFLLLPFSTVEGFRSKGGLYGAHAGYNWQFGRAVTGVEIDWSAAGIDGTSAASLQPVPQGTLAVTRSDRVKYLGTARGRLGWLPVDSVQLYGTAGAAWERVDETRSFAVSGPPSVNVSGTTPFDRLGWVAGVGVESMLFGPNWIGRLEYLHYDFGAVTPTFNVTSNLPNGSLSERSGRQTIDTLRAALSYKFGVPNGARRVLDAKASADMVAAGWTGFYLGAHGGYGWGKNDFSSNVNDVPLVQIGGTSLKGGVYGGQAGYNWQFDRAVAGLELDLSAADLSGAARVSYVLGTANIANTMDEKVEVLGSVRARLGWLPTDNVLVYGTAGLGWERLGRTTTTSTVRPASATTTVNDRSSDHFGWVAGAGVETLLPGGNWIGRLEYLHYGFGPVQISDIVASAGVTTVSSVGNHGVDVLRAGLSYKFGAPSTAVGHAEAPASTIAATWAGFYVGGHDGYGWQENDFGQLADFNTGATIGGITSRGWLAGGHVGHNWQYGRLVAGLETDFSFSNIEGASAPYTAIVGGGNPVTTTLSDKVKYLSTARARLGWSPAGDVLLYATGGLAWERLERIERTERVATISTRATPQDRFGQVIGAGVEWMPFGPNWIGRLEYLHYDFGELQETTSVATTVPGALSNSERRGRQTIETVRAAISYKFN